MVLIVDRAYLRYVELTELEYLIDILLGVRGRLRTSTQLQIGINSSDQTNTLWCARCSWGGESGLSKIAIVGCGCLDTWDID